MLIFIDTEFTDFVQIDLISIAIVSEDGQEFYAERTDYRHEDCNEFVRAAVLPMLGRVPGAACTSDQLNTPPAGLVRGAAGTSDAGIRLFF